MAAWRAWIRRDAVGLALAAVALLWRALVRSHSLVSFDAGLHANGVRSYDIPAGQPHPPGYPLTVVLGRVVETVTGDPVSALVWLSILWTGLAVYLLWRLGTTLGGPGAGVAAAVLFLLSPLALYNGATGLTYASDAAMGLVVACAAWHAGRTPDRRHLLLVGAALAVAVGIRPSALVFLAPLAAWPLLVAPSPRAALRRGLTVVASAVPVALAWLLPMLAFGGGPRAILRADRVQSQTVVLSDTVLDGGWSAVRDNLQHLRAYANAELAALPWIAGALLLLVAFAGRAGLRRLYGASCTPGKPRAAFVALWTAPALAFYTFVYAGWPVFPSGYLMVVLPPACLGLAGLGAALLRNVPASRWRAAAALAALPLLVPLGAAPEAWQESTRPIREADGWAASYAGFDAEFPPATTAIVMLESWQHVKLRHPEHLAFVRARYDHPDGETYTLGIQSRHGVDAPRWFDLIAMDPDDAPVHAIPDWVERIALHEGHPYTGPETLVKDNVTLHREILPTGRSVRWFEPRPEWRAIESYFDGVDPAWAEARLRQQEARA